MVRRNFRQNTVRARKSDPMTTVEEGASGPCMLSQGEQIGGHLEEKDSTAGRNCTLTLTLIPTLTLTLTLLRVLHT